MNAGRSKRTSSGTGAAAAWLIAGVLAACAALLGPSWALAQLDATPAALVAAHAYRLPLAVGLFSLALLAAVTVLWRRHGFRTAPPVVRALAALPAHEVEALVAEAHRQRGFLVHRTALGGADGANLVLRRDRQVALLQCAHWRRRIRLAHLQKLWQLVQDHRADRLVVLGLRDVAPDALAFARGHAIELVVDDALLALVETIPKDDAVLPPPEDTTPPPKVVGCSTVSTAPACPLCQAPTRLVRRHDTQRPYWRCVRAPDCDGTHAA
ncbi:restriction endonuclease [Coralloluteibacterium thermophilus]|uniref:Restriction endonuclease n=1 Tax=Coralloluteibacterium thermophilum TaxID=2707049 RepID=A0ABV9NLY2_9GAMM